MWCCYSAPPLSSLREILYFKFTFLLLHAATKSFRNIMSIRDFKHRKKTALKNEYKIRPVFSQEDTRKIFHIHFK